MARSLLWHPRGAIDMELADLFQQSERLWAENERVRQRLDETLRQARRSLGQQPDQQSAARGAKTREVPTSDQQPDEGHRPDGASEADQ